MWCRARVGGAVQPPEVALCTVFALQNMFDTGAAGGPSGGSWGAQPPTTLDPMEMPLMFP
jgi:hypothetical protein